MTTPAIPQSIEEKIEAFEEECRAAGATGSVYVEKTQLISAIAEALESRGADEREACADLADNYCFGTPLIDWMSMTKKEISARSCRLVASAIRARTAKPTTMTSPSEPLPCPFCGERLVLKSDHHGEWWAHRNEPGPCHASVDQLFDADDIARWNTRREPPR